MEVTQTPSYKEGDFHAFIPFTNEPQHAFAKEVRLKIQVPKYQGYQDGHQVYWHEPPMDTGSTGLAISAIDLGYTDEEQLQDYEKGTHYLSSSRVFYEGYWIPTTVTFPDGNVTAEVKVLAVTLSGVCLDFNTITGKCNEFSNEEPRGGPRRFPPEICYLGVGFGRWSSQQPNATADKNALINIVEANQGTAVLNSSIRQGYVITETGVWVGLVRENTQDFRFNKLSPLARADGTLHLKEWTETAMSMDYHDDHDMQGTVLFDTGISQSYLAGPAFNEVHRLPPGDRYQICIGNRGDIPPIEVLRITVNDFTDPITPAYVRVRPQETSFANTGRFFFRSFDLLFDAEEGWLGLRRRARSV